MSSKEKYDTLKAAIAFNMSYSHLELIGTFADYRLRNHYSAIKTNSSKGNVSKVHIKALPPHLTLSE